MKDVEDAMGNADPVSVEPQLECEDVVVTAGRLGEIIRVGYCDHKGQVRVRFLSEARHFSSGRWTQQACVELVRLPRTFRCTHCFLPAQTAPEAWYQQDEELKTAFEPPKVIHRDMRGSGVRCGAL